MIVVVATQNKHKIKEINAITEPFGLELKSLSDVGLENHIVEEDGTTFEENSLKKAMEIHKLCGFATLADDSGLMVDALDGAPGVYSARYAGEDADDEQNNKKLLQALSDTPKNERTAKFVSVITMVFPGGEVLCARGECKGHIEYEACGSNGFGYDPLFIPEGFTKSFAQLDAEEKNRISHRAEALKVLAAMLEERQKS
ncbi:MAG: XTP/dITP diphosphatase [Eubacteriales bacterium]|nr:XTP/dITP diphosphatase [Eubacteriales bacterium]MDD3350111.1 XTP/dITP diphosphatase [Eubacteriales bacterium]